LRCRGAMGRDRGSGHGMTTAVPGIPFVGLITWRIHPDHAHGNRPAGRSADALRNASDDRRTWAANVYLHCALTRYSRRSQPRTAAGLPSHPVA
jgi:hypothetical protein